MIPANLDYTRIFQYFSQTQYNLTEKLLTKTLLLLHILVRLFNRREKTVSESFAVCRNGACWKIRRKAKMEIFIQRTPCEKSIYSYLQNIISSVLTTDSITLYHYLSSEFTEEECCLLNHRYCSLQLILIKTYFSALKWTDRMLQYDFEGKSENCSVSGFSFFVNFFLRAFLTMRFIRKSSFLWVFIIGWGFCNSKGLGYFLVFFFGGVLF